MILTMIHCQSYIIISALQNFWRLFGDLIENEWFSMEFFEKSEILRFLHSYCGFFRVKDIRLYNGVCTISVPASGTRNNAYLIENQ